MRPFQQRPVPQAAPPPRRERADPPRPLDPREIPVCGLAAVRALFQSRAAAIKRLFFDQPTGRRVGGISGYMAGQRKVYRQVNADELEHIAGTLHHGGIVAIIDQPPLREPAAADLAKWARAGKPVVALDRIGNAHNLGAIVRTLAFFGVEQLIVAADERSARPGESTYRIAEGGMEHVTVWLAPDLPRFCASLREAGFAVIGTDVRGPILRSLGPREFQPKPRPGPRPPAQTGASAARPVALVMGNEEAGLAPEVARACDRLVRIPGAGKLESLNVATATAILVAALTIER